MFEGPIQDLIDELARLPGIGPKGAQRIAFHILTADKTDVERLADSLQHVAENVRFCSIDAAWFLEHGRIFAKQSKDVTLAVGRLCADRPSHALTIVDAFGIPDGFVEAKVAAGLTRRSGVREAPPLDDRILHSIGQPRRDPTDP